MKHTIIITDTPKSDAEVIAAAVAILQLRGVPLATQAKALRDICSFSAMLGQFENGIISRNSNRTPVIKPPLDPEPDCDKEHRLVWRSNPVVPQSPVEAIPAPSAGGSSAPAEVLPSPAPTQPVEPTIPPRSAGGILVRLWRFLFGR